jgi:hypothetical protein
MSLPPLPIPQDDWRRRWMVFPRWRNLHRVAEIAWSDEEDMISGEGATVCGRRGSLAIPGIFSRMGLKRCPQCCRAMGIPQGNGSPYNADILEPGDKKPEPCTL